MKSKRAVAAAVIAVVAVIAAIILMGGRSGAAGKALGPAASAESEAKAVKVSASAIKTLVPYIDESGDVEANVDVAVYPDIGGRLVNFTVALGDSVEKGQTIARVDPSKPGSTYAISSVVSPIAGTVTSVATEQGETVTTSTAIATVGIIDDLKVVVNLPERDSAKARKGMTARISLEALPGESFTAVVSRVSPVLDATSRTREISLVFPKADGRISAGMYAKVRLYLSPVSGHLVVPSSALLSSNGEDYVYVVGDKEGKAVAEKRVVKAGASVDGEVVVLDGLSAGDKVVYEGQDSLSERAAVSVLGEAVK